MDDKQKRRAMIDKIRALMTKTEDNGCSEAEAMSAARVVQRLMAEHALSQTEVELGLIEIIKREYRGFGPDHPLSFCLNSIAYATDTETWWTQQRQIGYAPQPDLFNGDALDVQEDTLYVFFGFEHDTEIAVYLVDVCRRALDNGRIACRNKMGRTWARGREHAFLIGMARSMSESLRTMRNERLGERLADGRRLKEVKREMVEAEMWRRKIRLKSNRLDAGRSVDRDALRDGEKAGRGVHFGAGIGGAGNQRAIGRA